jgi:hypothetical protein
MKGSKVSEEKLSVQKTREVIYSIRHYENVIEMPKQKRATYRDEKGKVHLKVGDRYAKDFLKYVNKVKEYLRFADEVEGVLDGSLERISSLKVCDTPPLLVDAGLVQLPMLYTQRHLLDALHEKSDENMHWHGLSVSLMKKLPELIEEPAMVFDSPSRPDSIMLLLDETDADGLSLIVSIRPGGKGIHELLEIESNFITSVYGKDNIGRYFEQVITPDKVVFIDKSKGQELERLAQLQLLRYYSSLDHGVILRQPTCVVNSLYGQAPRLHEKAKEALAAAHPHKGAGAPVRQDRPKAM